MKYIKRLSVTYLADINILKQYYRVEAYLAVAVIVVITVINA